MKKAGIEPYDLNKEMAEKKRLAKVAKRQADEVRINQRVE